MILSNVKIHEAIDQGSLIIEPDPQPRLRTTAGDPSPYDTTSVNLRLGNEVSWINNQPIVMDLRPGGFASFFSRLAETRRITPSDPYVLQPGHFVLARTLETVSLPIREGMPNLAARVEGQSSFARCGLLVHFTAPTIHAGFTGSITLEFINLGSVPIALYAEMPICQLLLERVDGTPTVYISQFHGQNTAAGSNEVSE